MGFKPLLSINAHKKRIEVVYYIDKAIPEFLIGDELKIRQVLLNLISNAVKFTNSGEILIEIKNILTENNVYEIEFSITDTGIGMSESTKQNLFQPFVQGDLSYTKQYQGTGLGLAISKHLINLMGGEIGFETEEYKGSRFYFRLKLEASNKFIHNIPNFDIDLNKLKVLFIDDNELNREITSKMLSSEGIKVITAEDGYKGIEILMNTKDIDLILLDVNMPKINGFEAFEKIKEICEIKNYKMPIVIAMTAYAMERDKEKCLNTGMDIFLPKPISIEKIKDVLEKIGKK